MHELPTADELLKGKLGVWLQGFESDRLAAAAKVRHRFKIGAVATLIVLGIFMVAPVDPDLASSLVFLFGVCAFGWARLPAFSAIEQVKLQINSHVADALGINYNAKLTPDSEYRFASAFQLLPPHQRATFEDCWSGMTGGQTFCFYEARLEARMNNRRRDWHEVFRGCIIAVTVSEQITGTTLITKPERARYFDGLMGSRRKLELAGIALERIDMVDPRLSETFSIWGSDAVESRYLVDPAYAERLLDIESAFESRNVQALFHANQLVIVLEPASGSGYNKFESGSLDPEADRALVALTIRQVASLLKLTYYMNKR